MTDRVAIPIALGLPQGFQAAAELAGARVRSHLVALAARLELPIDVQLGPATTTRSGRLELRVGMRTVVMAASDDDPPAVVAEELVRTAHGSRGLLITDDVVEAIGHDWYGAIDAAPAALGELVRRAVACGLRPGRLRDATIAAGAWTDADSADRLIDDALTGADNRIEIRAGTQQHAVLEEPAKLATTFELMRDGLFYELGTIYRVGPVLADRELDAGSFCFGWRDLQTPAIAGLAAGEILVNDRPDRLARLDVSARPARNPANGTAVAIAGEDARAVCEAAGLTTWTAGGYLVLHLAAALRREAAAFMASDVVEFHLLRLERPFPALAAEVRRRFSPRFMAAVLHELLEEEISVRDLPAVFEAALAVRGTTRVDFQRHIAFLPTAIWLYPSPDPRPPERLSAAEYADCVRMALKRQISHKYTRGSSTLLVYLLSPAIEAELAVPTLDGARAQEILAAIAAETAEHVRDGGRSPVILTSVEIRRRLAAMLHETQPNLAVLSYQDLSPDLNIQPISRIVLD